MAGSSGGEKGRGGEGEGERERGRGREHRHRFIHHAAKEEQRGAEGGEEKEGKGNNAYQCMERQMWTMHVIGGRR